MVDFGDVRSLLQLPPSHQTWAQLCAWVDQSEGEELEFVVLPYVRQHLSRWPDRMRVAPKAWTDKLLRAAPARLPQMAVASVWDLRAYAASRTSWRGEREEELTWLLGREELGHIHHLWLGRVTPTGAELAALTSNSAARTLQSLDLEECKLGTDDARALLEVGTLTGLRELSWTRAGLDDLWISRLISSALGAQLERLDVSHNKLSEVSIAGLLGGRQMIKLRALTLSKSLWADGEPLRWTTDNTPPVLTELTLAQLNLRGRLDDVLRGPLVARLERLDLWKTGLQRDDVSVLSRAKLGALRALDLSKNEVGDLGVKLLIASGNLIALEELSLFDAKVGDEGACAVVEAAGGNLPRLERINLLGNALSAEMLGKIEAMAEERGLEVKLPR